MDNNTQAFLALVRSGLWETEARIPPLRDIDFTEVYRLAEEQSVVGLVAAGLEHVVDVKPPKGVVMQFVGQALQWETRNLAMNDFIGVIVDKTRQKGIYLLLVKGQGIAQCYVRPLWRACGDVDFFMSEENYHKAKSYFASMPDSVKIESESGRHLGMTIGSWAVELHGNFHCGLSPKIDQAIDEVQNDVFLGGNVRFWMNGETQVFLPSPDNDIIFVFTHFLKHFYKGGLGLRQICDWCRLLWTYRAKINTALLEERLNKMRLMSEWKAFGAFAVEYLGMPAEAMPFYEEYLKWKRKAKRILSFVMSVGNMGHNREMSSSVRKHFFIKKAVSFSRRLGDFFNHVLIFPMDSLRFILTIIFNGLKSAAKGIG